MYNLAQLKLGGKYRHDDIINSYLNKQINLLINKISINIFIQLLGKIPSLFKCASISFSLSIVLACRHHYVFLN